MKPAPAISIFATAGSGGSAAAIASASLRGFWRAALGEAHGEIGREVAVLRVLGALDLDRDAALLRRAPRIRATRRAPGAARIRSGSSSRSLGVLSEGPQFILNASETLGPSPPPADRRRSTSAIPAAPGSCSTEGKPAAEKALQRRPRRALEQQVGAKVIGAPGDQRRRGAEHAHLCRRSAAPRRPRPRESDSAAPGPSPRRAAARDASTAASARRGAPRARSRRKPS